MVAWGQGGSLQRANGTDPKMFVSQNCQDSVMDWIWGQGGPLGFWLVQLDTDLI